MFLFSLATLTLFVFACVALAVCAGVLLACRCIERINGDNEYYEKKKTD